MSRRRSNALELAQQFADPLADIEPLEVEDHEEMETVIEDLEHQLSDPDDWSIRAEAMQKAMSYLKGGICEYDNCDYSSLAVGVASCVTDLRSALVRTGGLLIAACAQTLKTRYITSMKIIVPALFKPLAHGTAVISTSCKAAILEIAKHVQHRRTLNMILANSTSRGVEHRMAVAESLIVILQEWPVAVVAPSLDDVKNCIGRLVEDASADVRQIAKQARLLMNGDRSRNSDALSKSWRGPIEEARKPRTPTFRTNKPNQSLSKTAGSITPGEKTRRSMKLKRNEKPAEISPRKVIKRQRDEDESPKRIIKKQREASPSRVRQSVTPKQTTAKMEPVNRRAATPRQVRVKREPEKSPGQKVFAPIKTVETPDFHESLPDSPVSESKKTPFLFSPTPKKRTPARTFDQSVPRSPNAVRFVSALELPDSSNRGELKSIMKGSKSPITATVIQFDEPEPEEAGIESFIPPKTMSDAEEFQQALDRIVDSENYDKLMGLEELLPQSVISAARFIPQFEEWEASLPSLFQRYKDMFLYDIHEMLNAFRFNTDLFDLACEIFSAQVLFEHFATLHTKQQDIAIKFFGMFFHRGFTAEISERNRKYLMRLVHSNKGSPECDIIQSKLDESTNSEDPLMLANALIRKIQDNDDYSLEQAQLNDVLSLSSESIDEFRATLQEKLLDIILNGSDEQRSSILHLIQTTPLLPIDTIAESIINLLTCEDSSNHDSMQSFLASMLFDEELLGNLLSSLSSDSEDDEAREQVILSSLLQHVSTISTDDMINNIPLVFSHLVSILSSEIITLRRIAVFIIVEFNVKVPEQCTPYMKTITMAHQKLIALYTSKRLRS